MKKILQFIELGMLFLSVFFEISKGQKRRAYIRAKKRVSGILTVDSPNNFEA